LFFGSLVFICIFVSKLADMSKFFILFLFISSLSFAQTTVPLSKLEKNDNLYYLKGSDKLYTGSVLSKFKNHRVALTGKVVKGKAEGLWVWYYSNGNKKRSTVFVHGIKNGKTIYYYKNGQKRSEMDFVNDKNTHQTTWNEQGKVIPNPSF